VSQQIKALERTLGVTLLQRTSRKVQLTPEGVIFLADARRLLASADRAVGRVQAAARGEAGTVRLAYTLATAYDTVPTMLATANDLAPQLKIDAREVFGGDLVALFDAEQFDLAVAPKTSYPRGLRQRLIRQETFRLAVAEDHPLVSREQIPLSALQHERFELWPRAMAPGFYDAVAARTVRVRPSLVLSQSAADARKRQVGQSWVWSRVDGGSPIVAMSLAFWGWDRARTIAANQQQWVAF